MTTGSAMNSLRIVLVGGAVLAAVIAAAFELWLTVGILAAGVACHALLWLWLGRPGVAQTTPAAAGEATWPDDPPAELP